MSLNENIFDESTSSTWQRYPEYKDSGIEWLGEIPEHWDIMCLKYLAHLKSGNTITSSDIRESGEYPVYGGNGLRGYTSDYTHQGNYALVGRQGALCGNINYAHGKFWASEHAIVVTRLKDVNIFWLGELLRTMNLNQYSMSAAQPGIAVEQIKNLQIPVPSLEETAKIGIFLDRETERLDTLIAKKERLIELLQEQRSAIISHAVTKGLNPDVPMKESGIEWLGEIPSHWGVAKLKYLCSLLRDGTHQPPNRVDSDGYPLLSVRNITNGKFGNLPDDSLISEADFFELERSFKVKKKDILLAIVGATLGKVAIVPEMKPFTIQRSLAVFRPRPKLLDFRFLWYFFSSDNFQRLLWTNAGYSAQPGIYLGTLANFHNVLPPLQEQLEIIDYLNDELKYIDRIINKTQATIEKLQEYRTALISAAVTGKIDVRRE